MPVTLAQAQINTQSDVIDAVIDNLRRYSWLLDQIVVDDTVTPGTGGGSLTYGYTRLTNAAGAGFRDYNTEYTPARPPGSASAWTLACVLTPVGAGDRRGRGVGCGSSAAPTGRAS